MFSLFGGRGGTVHGYLTDGEKQCTPLPPPPYRWGGTVYTPPPATLQMGRNSVHPSPRHLTDGEEQCTLTVCPTLQMCCSWDNTFKSKPQRYQHYIKQVPCSRNASKPFRRNFQFFIFIFISLWILWHSIMFTRNSGLSLWAFQMYEKLTCWRERFNTADQVGLDEGKENCISRTTRHLDTRLLTRICAMCPPSKPWKTLPDHWWSVKLST